jgi:hypothetical protein
MQQPFAKLQNWLRMDKLLNWLLLLIPIALPVAVGAGQSRQDPLMGRWRSTEVSPAGVSAVFEFHEDQKMDTYSAAISDGTYRLVGTDTILLRS